jgi:hypothetical protein
MADEELSQIDNLAEQDVLDALGEKKAAEDDILIEDYNDESTLNMQEDETKDDAQTIQSTPEEALEESIETPAPSTTDLEVSSSEITSLLTQLLQNKTLEITIKIKE